MTMKIRMRTSSKGYILLLAVVFLAITISVAASMINYVAQFGVLGNTAVASAQALNLAEAGIDKSFDQLNQNPNYTGETDTALGAGTFSVSIAQTDSSTKQITSTACVPNCSNPLAQKTVKVSTKVSDSVVSFRYGVQVGTGGFSLTGGATINGSVYSNGDISAVSGVHITGTAVAANPPAITADQVNNTPTVPLSSVTFANTAAAQDFAQSFKISQSVPLNSIQFYLKKVGTPGDITVRITADSSGSPAATTLMSGVLSASLVTTNYGWVTVTMPQTPVLDPSQTYWMVLDTSNSTTKYYVLAANSGGYIGGTALAGKYAGSWSATTPAGLDGYFQLYLGGGTSFIGGSNNTTGVYVGTTASDSAWAHTVQGATVTGTIFCQAGTFTNKPCNTTQPDPSPQPMPVSDANVQDWKDDASTGGTISGDVHVGFAGMTLGPREITGNLTIDGGGILDVTGTLYVHGNITVTGGGKIQLDPQYGSNSGAIVSDGYVSLTGGSSFAGSGQAGSYPFLITTSACPVAANCNGNDAVYLSGGAGTVALIAQNGTVDIAGGSALKEVTAKEVSMEGGATLNYDSGLISENFMSGPGGSWVYLPGTYVVTH
jgi:hypothetical protein